jgi:hypothetical protein
MIEKKMLALPKTEFRVDAATNVVIQAKDYLYTKYKHYNFYFI